MESNQQIYKSLRKKLGSQVYNNINHKRIISRHIGKFVVLIITASFLKISKGGLMLVSY